MGNFRKGKSRKKMGPVSRRRRSQKAKKTPEAVHTPPPDNSRFLMDVNSLNQIIQSISEHAETCVEPSVRVLRQTWKHVDLFCRTCDFKYKAKKESDHHMLAINDALVVGAYCAGVGFTTLKTIFNCLEIKFVTSKTFVAAEDRVGCSLSAKWKEESKSVGVLEKKLATEVGDVVKIGNEEWPFITVIVDGGWPTRSYGHSYRSNGGVGVIIGANTKKVLFVDHRIKTCRTCMKSPDKDHKCYKNWNLSAQAMESDIIVTGFQQSLEEHGLIYRYMVGDADSSVFSKVQASNVYPERFPITKVDCVNHAVRGLNSKLYSLKSNTSFPKEERDWLSKHIDRFGRDVRCAVMYNQINRHTEVRTNASTLSQNILNTPAHSCGCHDNCGDYFCRKGGIDVFSDFKKSAIGKEVMKAFHLLANRSHRLIYNTTSNSAESFMSIMNKLTSGKRINYTQRGSYSNRTLCAAFEFNFGSFWPADVFGDNNNACQVWIQASREAAATKKVKKAFKISHPSQTRKVTSKANKKSEDTDYGENALDGRKSPAEIKLAIENLVESLKVQPEERNEIETRTVGQSSNTDWILERRNRVTASSSGRIFKLKDWTKNTCTLKNILYPPDLSKNPHILNGLNLEPEARSFYSDLYEKEVRECGLFVDPECGVIGASPDGVIDEDGILEVKCIACDPADEPRRKSSFLKFGPNQELSLKRNHNYFFQVVCQIYVTNRKYCDFFVFHKPKDTEDYKFFLERITRSPETDALWEEMKLKLLKFYMEDMAPEIVDPIFHTAKAFRTPEYRRTAIERKAEEKASKNRRAVS